MVLTIKQEEFVQAARANRFARAVKHRQACLAADCELCNSGSDFASALFHSFRVWSEFHRFRNQQPDASWGNYVEGRAR